MYENDWPHAPLHRMNEAGLYSITGATYLKQHFYVGAAALDVLESVTFELAAKYALSLHAWSFFTNHYHLILDSLGRDTLPAFFGELHTTAASRINERDGTIGRRVWYQCWDTKLTYEKSYLARLKYVMTNPEHHGIARRSENCPWCSAAWFAESAPKPFVRTVQSMEIDRVTMEDDFEVPRKLYRASDAGFADGRLLAEDKAARVRRTP